MVFQETAIHGSKVPENPSKGSKDTEEEPSCLAGRWTQEEHMLFLQGLDLHGKEWKKISKMVKSRSLVQIRSHAQKYFQKLSATADEDDDASSASGGRVLLMNGKRGGARFEKTTTTTALPPKKKSGSSKKNSARGGCVQASSSAPAPSSKAPDSKSSSKSKGKKKRASHTRGSVHVKAAVAASSSVASKKAARSTATPSDDHSVLTTKSGVSASTAHHSVGNLKREQAVPESDVESDGSGGADYGSSTSGTSVDSMSQAFAVEGDIEALDMMHPDDIDLFLDDLFPEDEDQVTDPQLAPPQLMVMQQPAPVHLLPLPPAPTPLACGAPTFHHYVHHTPSLSMVPGHAPSLSMGHPPTLSMVHQVYPQVHPVVHSAPCFIDNSVHTNYVPEHIDTWMSTVDIQQHPGHLSLTPFVVTNAAP